MTHFLNYNKIRLALNLHIKDTSNLKKKKCQQNLKYKFICQKYHKHFKYIYETLFSNVQHFMSDA